MTVSVKNIINEAYSRDISVNTRSAIDIKRRSGDFVGAFTVYGYLKTDDKHKSDFCEKFLTLPLHIITYENQILY